ERDAMTRSHTKQTPFRLNRPQHGAARKAVSFFVNPALERALALNRLNKLYDRVNAMDPDQPFVEKILEAMSIRVSVAPAELKRIPDTGPLLIVSNHPFGAIDGIALMSILNRIRPDDAQTMANFILGRIEELRPSLILVDPFNSKQSTSRNLAPLKQAIRHLKSGGALGMFPAGEVAHFEFANRGITDPPWTDMVGRLVRRTNATVVPFYFHGTNSPMFHLMGLVHPRLRTALLAREMLKKNRTTLSIRVGKPITADRLAKLESDRAVTDYCRARCDMLAARDNTTEKKKESEKSHAHAPALQPIADPVDPETIAREIAALPQADLLLESSDQQIYCTTAANIPNTLKEIGRLREVAFRAVGEGSGKPIDLDRFDHFYHQLFIWKPDTRQIVGGYRLGLTDQLVQRYGMKGLYTHTLFKFNFE
ncbi:MAG: lysophospholipid acyltransferase family protein, partial [Desulfobacterales bacterium]|nr:lysophospholipid acyltransferase family protein [Desulfobacterales bacterium]